jgi:hypothetical protein
MAKCYIIYSIYLSLQLKTYTVNNNMTFSNCKQWPNEGEQHREMRVTIEVLPDGGQKQWPKHAIIVETV